MARRPTPGGSRGPQPLGQLLTVARQTAARRAGVALDRETWREVAGARIAQRSAPGSLEGGVLEVTVASPVWAQELSFLAEDIVGKLRERGVAVTRIRFRTGKVEAAAPREPAPRRAKPIELPEDAKQRLAQIDDPELREVIARAMGQSLANQAQAGKPELKPAARAPRSAAPGSARSDRDAPKPSGARRRNREED
ncbi:MAG: DUF721 domain-containing protein [Myxococcales bacterium]|nr:DUF721 domain-containing protein [Myxococcales bacterium]